MKILQLIQKKQFRGAEIFAAQLSSHLTDQGDDVLIISLAGGDAVLPFSGKTGNLDAVLGKKYYDWNAWKKLAGIIKEFRPDIIQANAGDTLKYAVFSKKIFRWKQPVIFRNASTVSRYANGTFSKQLTSFLLKNADHIISVSQSTKDDLLKTFKLNEKKITVLPVGIELKPYNELNTFNNTLINLVHVGGFSFEKNHERLLAIFKILWQRDNRYRLWLIGEGALMNKIKVLSVDLGIGEVVFFEGFTNAPLDYISSADVFLLPSKIEGLPAVIAEAFYCRVPVVAYNVGGIGSLLKNNITGWLVEPGDEANFIKAVADIVYAGKAGIKHITDRAYKEVITNYSNKKIAREFAEVYRSLVNKQD